MKLKPHPGRFSPGNENQYQLYTRPGGPHVRSGPVRKISSTLAFDYLTEIFP
jgi:hypothetical protein